MRLVERPLQLLQLVVGECGAIPSLFPLGAGPESGTVVVRVVRRL